nr:hypothetical protein [Tanacetum cinerariifolium]
MLPGYRRHTDIASRGTCGRKWYDGPDPTRHMLKGLDERHVRMKGTSGWKGRLGERDIRMEGTPGWKAHPDERQVWIEGTSGWKGRLDERHVRMEATFG